MKKTWLPLTGVLCAAMVFSTSAVFASNKISNTSVLQEDVAEVAQAFAQKESGSIQLDIEQYQQTMLPDAHTQLPDVVVYTEEEVASLPVQGQNLISQVVEPPVEIQEKPSEQDVQIQQDMTGTVTADTVISGGTGNPIDDSPETSEESSESSSSESSSESSEPTSSDHIEESSSAAGERNPLETLLDMPSYTPYGKTLSISINGTTYKADAVVVVSGMVQSEIVGSSGSSAYQEAYKAQAVASHSYVKSNNNKGIVPSVYARHPSEDTVRLVEQVIGQMVYYNGSVAETVYCAASGLHTQGNQYYWGGSPIPYLQGVDSKYDESPGSKSFTVEEMRQRLTEKGYDTSGDPSTWFQITEYSDGGFISRVSICGQSKSGMTLHYLLNLRSAKASIVFDGSTFSFTTNGYGHGIGLSQQGAMGYAKYDGWSYTQILNHYYPGTSVY